MRYGIFSDVHSNLEAFNSVLSAYEQEQIDVYLCVGDIVGYGADPKACIQNILDRNIVTVAGNHDWAATQQCPITYFNPYAKQAVLWTRKHVDPSDISYLNNLDLIYKKEDFCLVHGTLVHPDGFDYMMGVGQAKATFGLMDCSICFVGHTHAPVVFIKDEEKISYSRSDFVNIDPQKRYIFNVGSVGQPRDRDSRACYCIYDSTNKVVETKRISYDIQMAQKKILDAGLPSFLAMRLSYGQ